MASALFVDGYRTHVQPATGGGSLNRPPSRFQPAQPLYRTNGKIRAREVRVIGENGQQIGVLDLAAAINMARSQGVDLVEIAPNAQPPVCRIVDFGKFKYELAKKERDAKKHQHSNQVKEIQLSARIDPHDLKIKLQHAIDFLCEEMKVKIALRFRGREMAHTEFGFQVVNKFITEIAPWGHPDSPPRLTGKTINVMIGPQPKHKRAKNPHEDVSGGTADGTPKASVRSGADEHLTDEATPADGGRPSAPSPANAPQGRTQPPRPRVPTNAAEQSSGLNNPFSKLNLNPPPASSERSE